VSGERTAEGARDLSEMLSESRLSCDTFVSLELDRMAAEWTVESF
jgi:hypothetical protein